MRGVSLPAAVQRRARIRDERARAEERELSRVPSAAGESGAEGASRVHDLSAPDGVELPELPRVDLPGVSAKPARCGVVGGGVWRAGADGGAGEFRGAVSSGVREAAAASVHATGRAVGDDERVRAVPRDRASESGRVGGKLHGVPHAAYELGGDRARAADVRAVPHGSGPFADRDLRRVEARHPVQRAVGAAEFVEAAEAAHDA